MKANYHYAGFGQLVPEDGTPQKKNTTINTNTITKIIKTVATSQENAGATGKNGTQGPQSNPSQPPAPQTAPTFDAQGRTMQDRHYRYTYTPAGQIDTVTDKTSGKLLASYRYNSLGQRVAKTVITNGKETTTYTLWQDGKRVAEMDDTGDIQAQYLYLAEGQRATPIAQLEGKHINFIHADHRGAPIAMTDERQAIVWRANVTPWGTAQPQGTNAKDFGPASLNLRLPGQYFDAETGLHENWHRTYDPILDLQGHTLGRGRLFKNSGGVGISINDAKNIHIKNGVLQDFRVAVLRGPKFASSLNVVEPPVYDAKTNTYRFAATNIVIENVTFRNNKKDILVLDK